jgi:hypothetical protein
MVLSLCGKSANDPGPTNLNPRNDMLMSLQFLLFGSQSSLATNACTFRKNVFAIAFIAVFAISAPAHATVVSVDAITIGAGEVLRVDSLVPAAVVPVLPPSPLVVDALTLTISSGGVLDIQDNVVIVRLPDFPALYSALLNGYDGGTWAGHSLTGGNIVSSVAASDPTHLTAVGIVDNSEAEITTFHGRDVSAFTEALIQYTYYGDANLDGDVNQADYSLMGTGFGWYHGDFNYSGSVDAADYALFNASFQALHPGEPIPEPGLSALFIIGAASLFSSRPPRSSKG